MLSLFYRPGFGSCRIPSACGLDWFEDLRCLGSCRRYAGPQPARHQSKSPRADSRGVEGPPGFTTGLAGHQGDYRGPRIGEMEAAARKLQADIVFLGESGDGLGGLKLSLGV